MQIVCKHPKLWSIAIWTQNCLNLLCFAVKRFRQLFVKTQLSCFTLVEWPSVTPTVSKVGNSNKSHIAQTNKNVCVVCIQQYVGAPCGCRLELAALAARSRPRPLECRFCLRDRSHTGYWSCEYFSLAFDLAGVFSHNRAAGLVD